MNSKKTLLPIFFLLILLFTSCRVKTTYAHRKQLLLDTLPSHIGDYFRAGEVDKVVQYIEQGDEKLRKKIDLLKKNESVIYFTDSQFIRYYYTSIYKKAIDKSVHF